MPFGWTCNLRGHNLSLLSVSSLDCWEELQTKRTPKSWDPPSVEFLLLLWFQQKEHFKNSKWVGNIIKVINPQHCLPQFWNSRLQKNLDSQAVILSNNITIDQFLKKLGHTPYQSCWWWYFFLWKSLELLCWRWSMLPLGYKPHDSSKTCSHFSHTLKIQ